MLRGLAACALLALLLPAVAAAQGESAEALEAADETTEAEADAADAGDPWEGFNRKIFAFNETLDRYALEPIATGYDYVVPERVQTCVGNFAENLMFPNRLANDLLQLKILQAYETLWRAIVNTTFGIGGLFDVASAHQIYKSDEDFGQTLGVWGVPPGPYLMLPLLGPSSPRDAAGLAVDAGGRAYTWFIPFWASFALSTVNATDIVNTRAGALETIREERAQAFDWYAAVRSAYTQYRENRVHDRAEAPEEESDDDLYYDVEE